MSSFITSAGENYVLDLLTAAYSPYPTYFVALMNELPPTRYVSGSELDEPAVADYARAVVVNDSGNWSSSFGLVSNTIEVLWPPAISEWGVIKHWALCTSDTGGDVLWAGTFGQPLTVHIADQVSLPIGTLVFKITNYQVRTVL